MKISEIIKNAATILGLTDVVDVIDNGSIQQRLVNTNFRILLRATNLVLASLVMNHAPLKQPDNKFVSNIVDGEEENPFDLPPQTLEYGILAEYAFITGMFNEAQVWRIKMGEMLFSAKHKTGESKTMPPSFRG